MGSQDNLITSLSGGNQQKVLIARAFAEKPSVLVLNDPAQSMWARSLISIGTCGTSPQKGKLSFSY
jgi:ribose transport system ATP-binding protein